MGIVEEGTNFGFSGGGQYIFHKVALDVECAIDGGFRGSWVGGIVTVITKPEEATTVGTGFGFGAVGGITVDVEDHVAGSITDGSIGMSGSIVEEVGSGISSSFGANGLGRGQSTQGWEHGIVDGTGIE